MTTKKGSEKTFFCKITSNLRKEKVRKNIFISFVRQSGAEKDLQSGYFSNKKTKNKYAFYHINEVKMKETPCPSYILFHIPTDHLLTQQLIIIGCFI